MVGGKCGSRRGQANLGGRIVVLEIDFVVLGSA